MANKGDFTIENIIQAAEAGITYYQWMLGRLYQRGNSVPQDYEKAINWFTLAAWGDNEIAQYDLACCYLDGTGVERDIEKAIFWLEKAAKAGHADAQAQLGLSD